MSAFAVLITFDGRRVAAEELAGIGRALGNPALPRPSVQVIDGAACVFHLNPFTPEDHWERPPYRLRRSADKGGSGWVVADARLDNRTDLLRVFEIGSNEATRTPDGALVARAVDRWGQGCVAHLRGDFVVVVWEPGTRQVWAACGPMASRTLAYHWHPNGLVATTLIGAIHAAPEVPRVIDHEVLAWYLASIPLPAGRTVFRGVHRVPSGHTMVATAEGVQVRRFWQVPTGTLRLKTDADYRDALLDVFTEAVRTRLRSTGPVGISMSGGLDSSSVAAVAARLLGDNGRRLSAFTLVHRRTFTAGVEPRRVDPEFKFVEAMRAHCPNLDVTYLPGLNDRLLDDLRGDFEHTGIPPYSLLFQRRHRTLFPVVRAHGIRVLLNGNNGNTTISFSGADAVFRWFLTGQWRRTWHGLRTLRSLNRYGLRSLVVSHLLGPWKGPRPLTAPGLTPEAMLGLQSSTGAPGGWRAYVRHIADKADPNSARRRMFDSGTYDLVADLWPATRARWDIDERDPTMDQRVVEFCFSLPMEQYLRKGSHRHLIRFAMAPYLPPMVAGRLALGDREPDLSERIDEVREEAVERLRRRSRGSVLPFLDLPALESLLSQNGSVDSRGRTDAARLALRAVMVAEYAAWFDGAND